MDIEQDNGNINAQILAQTTAEQEQKKRIVRFILACAGVSFLNSTWYVYVIQVLGLAAQGWVLYMLSLNILRTFYMLNLFIQVFPWCYLCFLTRSSERQYLDKIIENLTVKWWMLRYHLCRTSLLPCWFHFSGVAQLGSFSCSSYSFQLLSPY